jgi:adenylylsulfate kinase
MESHARTIAKALSWRFVATTITFTVAWLITRKLTFAAEIGIADTIIKLGAYYFHERLWIRIKFGKLIRPEYEI